MSAENNSKQIDSYIVLLDNKRKINTKASEEYVHVKFQYPEENIEWNGWIPVEYRRTGVSIPSEDNNKLKYYLSSIYSQMHPSLYTKWLAKQEKYWNTTRSVETKAIFNILKDGKWHCRNCDISNPNFARRIQDLKEMGYTIATHINYHCPVCKNKRSTRLLLLPIDRIELTGNGYETWSPTLRNRIIKVLGGIDVYENTQSKYCIPDHKFSEIRWDNNTKQINPDNMSDEEIKNKFQLLTNQRNQQKREICRKCFQTGKRGSIFGISYFYEGTENWDTSIPQKGKSAERGCIGCPWYDIAEWRNRIQSYLQNKKK